VACSCGVSRLKLALYASAWGLKKEDKKRKEIIEEERRINSKRTRDTSGDVAGIFDTGL